MLLNDLLKVKEDVYLIEGSFEGLGTNHRSLDYLRNLRRLPRGAVEKAVILAEGPELLGTAYLNRHEDGDFWFLIPTPHAPAEKKQTETLGRDIRDLGVVASVKTRKTDPRSLAEALREYLAVSLVQGALCDCDREKEPPSFARNEARETGIRRLMKAQARKHGYDLVKLDALEICCGNGMSTAPLKSIFGSVLSVDNDRCAICNGLDCGILEPESTMVADATELSKYGLPRFGAVVGFMLGTIYEFNKPVWRRIFEESLKMVQDGGFLFFTVSKEEEMDFMAESFASMGVRGDVVDNRQKDSIYDNWGLFMRVDCRP